MELGARHQPELREHGARRWRGALLLLRPVGACLLDPYREVFGLQFPDINTTVGISRPAFPINASDRIWQKYKLGERWNIMDPATKQPAVRNIYLSDGDVSVKALQDRGTVFWQCNVALGGIVQELAQATSIPATEVRADLIAGFVPGVRLVPSHVLAIGLVQERGFTI